MKKESNPKPRGYKSAPPPPPLREFRTGFLGMYETEENKQNTRDWRAEVTKKSFYPGEENP